MTEINADLQRFYVFKDDNYATFKNTRERAIVTALVHLYFAEAGEVIHVLDPDGVTVWGPHQKHTHFDTLIPMPAAVKHARQERGTR